MGTSIPRCSPVRELLVTEITFDRNACFRNIGCPRRKVTDLIMANAKDLALINRK